MDPALQEELIGWVSPLLICFLPALVLLLLVAGRHLRVGFYWLPVLVVLGWSAALFFRDRYEVPLATASATAHLDPNVLVDYDPIGGNVAVLFFGWVFPSSLCLLALLLVYLHRRFFPRSQVALGNALVREVSLR